MANRLKLLWPVMLSLLNVAAADPLREYFSSEKFVAQFEIDDEVPAALLLEPRLRAELTELWREREPLDPAARRLKGLLLEDAEDDAALEALEPFPADWARLLWRGGRLEEARDLVILNEDRADFVRAAMLPLVARGMPEEIEGFRDFLLENLPPATVVTLCRASGLPPGMGERPAIMTEWRKAFPELPGAGDLRRVERALAILRAPRPNLEELEEVREWLASDGATPEQRRTVVEELENARGLDSSLGDVLLLTWMEHHPEEVGEVLAERPPAGNWWLARASGPVGLLHLRRLVEREPENRSAWLALAYALRGFGVSAGEVEEAWRHAVDLAMEVPGEATPGMTAPAARRISSTGAAALHFAARELPVWRVERWFGEWRRHSNPPAHERAIMAGWLGLRDEFRAAWPEAVRHSAAARGLIETLQRQFPKWSDGWERQAVPEAMAALPEDEASDEMRRRSGLPVPPRGVAEAELPPAPDIPVAALQPLEDFRVLLANALAAKSPFRFPPPPGMAPPLERGIRLFGYQALEVRPVPQPRWLWIIGPHVMRTPEPDDGKGVAEWLGRLDVTRLTPFSQRALEASRIALFESQDPVEVQALRDRLAAWWEDDGDVEAGKMLLAFRVWRDREAWKDWRGLWSELLSALPAHERAPFAREISLGLPPPVQAAVLASAGLDEREADGPMRGRLPLPEARDEQDRARVSAMLGRDSRWSPWGAEKTPTREQEEAEDAALETLERMGVAPADLAHAAYLLATPRNRAERRMAVWESSRLTPRLASSVRHLMRKRQDAEGLDRCLLAIAEAGGTKALETLADPAAIGILGAKRIAWLAGVAFEEGRRNPGKLEAREVIRLADLLARSATPEAATWFAETVCGVDTGQVMPLLPWLREGPERVQWIAATLAADPHQQVVFEEPATARDRLALLGAPEWERVTAHLADDAGWDSHSGISAAILAALVAGGVDDPAVLDGFAGFDEAAGLPLFQKAVRFATQWPEPYAGRISAMASAFALEVPPGDPSRQIVEWLSDYPLDHPGVGEAFLVHAAHVDGLGESGWRRLLALTGGEAGLDAARDRLGPMDSPHPEILRVASIFLEAGYAEEGWALVEPVVPGFLELDRSELSRFISELLRMARAAGRDEVVRQLVEAAGNSAPGEISRSKDWLEARAAGPQPPESISARALQTEPGRGRIEWTLGRRGDGAIETEGGEWELVATTEKGEQLSILREPSRGAEGVFEFELQPEWRFVQATYRTKAGKLLSWHTFNGFRPAVGLQPVEEGTPAAAPFPDLEGRAYDARAVLAEAPFEGFRPEAGRSGSPMLSAWVRGPVLKDCWFVLSWHDPEGRRIGEQRVNFRNSGTGWTLVSELLSSKIPGVGLGSLRVALERPPGKALEIAGIHISDGSNPGPPAVGRVPLRPSWINASSEPWLIGGTGLRGPAWTTWDPAARETGPVVELQAEPVWLARAGEEVLVLDAAGDLWRFLPDIELPELVFAFGTVAPALSLSRDGRWLVACHQSQRLAVWDLAQRDRVAARNSADIPFCSFHKVIGSGDEAVVAAGTIPSSRDAIFWYTLPGIDRLDVPPEKDPGVSRSHDGRVAIAPNGDAVQMPLSVIGSAGVFDLLPDGRVVQLDTRGGIHIGETAADQE